MRKTIAYSLKIAAYAALLQITSCGDKKEPILNTQDTPTAAEDSQGKKEPPIENDMDIQYSKSASGKVIATFKRIRDPYLTQGLGKEVWQHANLLWGSPAQDDNGKSLNFSYEKALPYCAARNARVPSFHDWNELRIALGARRQSEYVIKADGYRRQILPYLGWYWSSTLAAGTSGSAAYYFEALDGSIRWESIGDYNIGIIEVVCVRDVPGD
jgi:hypothetical protein